jgi:hypothetical protein
VDASESNKFRVDLGNDDFFGSFVVLLKSPGATVESSVQLGELLRIALFC